MRMVPRKGGAVAQKTGAYVDMEVWGDLQAQKRSIPY